MTVAVAALVSDSELPPSSVKDTRSLMILPSSALTRAYVESVAPAMSVSVAPWLATHW